MDHTTIILTRTEESVRATTGTIESIVDGGDRNEDDIEELEEVSQLLCRSLFRAFVSFFLVSSPYCPGW